MVLESPNGGCLRERGRSQEEHGFVGAQAARDPPRVDCQRNAARSQLASERAGYYHGSMQRSSRRPHGIQSSKISISVSAEDLKTLSAQAKRLHRGNVSALVHDMIAALKRGQAADDLLDLLGGEAVTERDIQAVRDEVASAPTKRRRPRRAA